MMVGEDGVAVASHPAALSCFASAHSDENIFHPVAAFSRPGLFLGSARKPMHRIIFPSGEIWFASAAGRAFFGPSRSFLSQL